MLSGLARAFFYAGARTLLVSHWYIDSHAALQLTTRTVQRMEQTRRRCPHKHCERRWSRW